MKDPAIIVTTGHAGSSALVKILNKLGLFIGKNLSVAHKKFFENKFFQTINRKMLGSQGYPYPFMPAPRMTALGKFVEDENYIIKVREQAFNAMKKEGLGDDALWGFKDPRTCLTFPFWNRVFPNAKWVMLDRKKDDVHKGWHTKGDDGYFYYYDCFVENMEMLCLEGKDYFLLHYDDVSFKWLETMRTLVDWIGLDVTDNDIEECRKLWKPKYDGKVTVTKG
jgi:hypothetical protein